MDKEEAIKRFEQMVEDDGELGCLLVSKDIEALDMAISALSENKGEWIKYCITPIQPKSRKTERDSVVPTVALRLIGISPIQPRTREIRLAEQRMSRSCGSETSLFSS